MRGGGNNEGFPRREVIPICEFGPEFPPGEGTAVGMVEEFVCRVGGEEGPFGVVG